MGCSSSKVTATPDANGGANKESEDDFIEGVVCKTEDLKENEMKQFELGEEGKVLLVKQHGKISAIGTKCTHYGAPLVQGALGDGRVRCQWHGACFSFATGDIEDFPGLDSLPCYKVTIEDNNVKVRARKTELETNKRVKPMVKRDKRECQTIVVVGGGPAGAACVEALRQEGFAGRVVLLCKEDCLPYDRVKVSKAMDFEIEKAEFRDMKFYEEYGIEVMKGVAATSVNTQGKTVCLSNGKSLNYDRMFIATGCKAKKLNIPGADLKNVVTLRDYADSKYTNAELGPEKEVVVLGSSFIAMESANYCLNKVKKVTVVFRATVPFKKLLGDEVGAAFLKFFKDKGINFYVNTKPLEIESDENGYAKSVKLDNGEVLKADIVIMGLGSTYYTEFLQGSGVELQPDGSIETNEFLQTNVPEIYAGGDIAYSPVWSHHNKKSAIGHYPLAHYHGKMAALNMLGKKQEIKAVPYFWTMLFGKGVRYAGHGKYDDVIITGDLPNLKFVAFYLDGDEVVAISSCGMDPVVSQFAERLAQDRKLYRKDLKDDPLAWTKSV